jgi:hypothetical protein
VKLHRKLLDSDIGKNFLLLGLWLTLIRWANWTETKVNWRGVPRTLARGEMLTSVKELADYGEVDRKTVSKWLNYLALRGSIQVEKSPRGSRLGLIIKVLNYEKYQSIDALYSHETGDEPTHEHGHESPRSMDMSMDTYEESKNKRNKEVRPVLADTNPVQVDSAEELLNLFDQKRRGELEVLYPDPGFIDREAIKAVQYYRDNPRKTPKTGRGWKMAFTSWLTRGWRYHVKSIASESPSGQPTYNSIETILANEAKQNGGAA